MLIKFILALVMLWPVEVAASSITQKAIQNFEATATGAVTTTSTSYVLMPGMTLTPPAGTYLVLYSFWTTYSAANQAVFGSIYAGGTFITTSQRVARQGQSSVGTVSNFGLVVAGHDIVTVNGSQAIELRWQVSTGTGTANDRTLSIIRIQ